MHVENVFLVLHDVSRLHVDVESCEYASVFWGFPLAHRLKPDGYEPRTRPGGGRFAAGIQDVLLFDKIVQLTNRKIHEEGSEGVILNWEVPSVANAKIRLTKHEVITCAVHRNGLEQTLGRDPTPEGTGQRHQRMVQLDNGHQSLLIHPQRGHGLFPQEIRHSSGNDYEQAWVEHFEAALRNLRCVRRVSVTVVRQ